MPAHCGNNRESWDALLAARGHGPLLQNAVKLNLGVNSVAYCSA